MGTLQKDAPNQVRGANRGVPRQGRTRYWWKHPLTLSMHRHGCRAATRSLRGAILRKSTLPPNLASVSSLASRKPALLAWAGNLALPAGADRTFGERR